jgi:hypothetical protein
MGFDKRDTAKKYTPADGDTLESIAQNESASGPPITWQEIAKFNWGTDDPKVVDEMLRDELGCYLRGDDKRFVFAADCEVRTPLFIPVPFKKPGLSTTQTHTLKVKRQPPPPKQYKACAGISGATFEFDKSFLRPSVADDLKAVGAAMKANPNAKVMIFGHTDKVGTEKYNKGLSERRAKSVYAFITNQPDIWETLYNEEHWGTKSVQEILKDMGDPYDPGPVDGIDGPLTQAAVRQFQTDIDLKVDGIAGEKTRKKLFEAYMAGKHDIEIDDGQFMDPKHMGCGEFNPMIETEEKCEDNRRVMFYLFDPARLPNLPCKIGDIAPCKKQVKVPLPRYKDEFHCSFYDSLAKDCPGDGGTPLIGLYNCGGATWIDTQVHCGDEARLESTITGGPPDGPVKVEILHPSNGSVAATIDATMTGGKIQTKWVAKALTADWRNDAIAFRVQAAGITCESSNELAFRQRPTTAWTLRDVAHPCGNGFSDAYEHTDACLEADRVHYSTKYKLDGDPFDATKQQAAKTLIENVWNNGFAARKFHRKLCKRGDACDCTFDCCKVGFRFDVNFVESGQHVLVHIHATAPGQPTYRSSMGHTEADFGDPAKSPLSTYPHETGHALGQYDEYPDGGIDPNYSAANPDTQPPDAVALGQPNLMSSMNNQIMMNRFYRWVRDFLNANSGGDQYKIIPP